jgi:hypothetical protein
MKAVKEVTRHRQVSALLLGEPGSVGYLPGMMTPKARFSPALVSPQNSFATRCGCSSGSR